MSQKFNRKYKDALFKIIFGEHRENSLSLYNAINGTNYGNVDDLEITTLEDGIYIGIRNDVSFLFNNEMTLYEHQSTFCPNMPLRGLGYFAELYKQLLGGDDAARERMYDKSILHIPAPKYYVFYNGRNDQPERTDLHLSSAYDGDGDIEVVAHMLNINKGCNEGLMKACRPLSDYMEVVSRLREYLDKGYSNEEAADRTIDDCIRDGILEDILRRERARVINALIEGLTEEQREHLFEIQLERATREAQCKGREEGEKRMLSMTRYLIEQGRFDDLTRAFEDADYRASIMAEMQSGKCE